MNASTTSTKKTGRMTTVSTSGSVPEVQSKPVAGNATVGVHAPCLREKAEVAVEEKRRDWWEAASLLLTVALVLTMPWWAVLAYVVNEGLIYLWERKRGN